MIVSPQHLLGVQLSLKGLGLTNSISGPSKIWIAVRLAIDYVTKVSFPTKRQNQKKQNRLAGKTSPSPPNCGQLPLPLSPAQSGPISYSIS